VFLVQREETKWQYKAMLALTALPGFFSESADCFPKTQRGIKLRRALLPTGNVGSMWLNGIEVI